MKTKGPHDKLHQAFVGFGWVEALGLEALGSTRSAHFRNAGCSLESLKFTSSTQPCSEAKRPKLNHM